MLFSIPIISQEEGIGDIVGEFNAGMCWPLENDHAALRPGSNCPLDSGPQSTFKKHQNCTMHSLTYPLTNRNMSTKFQFSVCLSTIIIFTSSVCDWSTTAAHNLINGCLLLVDFEFFFVWGNNFVWWSWFHYLQWFISCHDCFSLEDPVNSI